MIRDYHGDHAEIGRLIGSYYLAEKATLLYDRIDNELYQEQLTLYKKFFPKKLVQLRAIAEAANYDVDNFIYRNICGDIKWHKNFIGIGKGCTIFGVKNSEGTYVGRNYDWKPGTEKVFQVFRSYNTDAYSYIGVTDMDYSGRESIESHQLFYDIDDAINEHGLYIGLTFAYAHETGVGLSPIHMNQLVAETCKTVKEALAVFEKVPLAVPKNFFIADANGDMAVVEHTSSRFKVLRSVNNILIQTNHYIDPELATIDKVLEHNSLSTTYKRYAEVLEQLTAKKDHIHEIGIEKICDKPGSEVLERHRKIATIWSLSLDMTGKHYRLYWDLGKARKEETLSL